MYATDLNLFYVLETEQQNVEKILKIGNYAQRSAILPFNPW